MAFTFFFRDAQTLELAVQECVLQTQGQRYIDIWDAGCAHGPEPFTVAMLLRERMSHFLFRNVRILATDVEVQFASQLASGVFMESEVQRIPLEHRKRYFCPADRPGHVQVIEELRDRVCYRQHDLLGLVPPEKTFDLIVCKNVLLHFSEAERSRVVAMFHDALRPHGLLAMEHTQHLPAESKPHFECLNSFARIFRKAGKVARLHPAHDPALSGTRLNATVEDSTAIRK